MKEYGGYIELDRYAGEEYYKNLIKLNCGRSALAYLIEAKRIEKIYLPYWLCSSIRNVCQKYNLDIHFYHVGLDFRPQLDWERIQDETYVYIVNYYGQLTDEYFLEVKEKHEKIIVDNAQAFFQKPLYGIDTIYTCRKFFGVPDGAYISTDVRLGRNLEKDISYDRMHFLLGRFEKNASDFYSEYIANNRIFENEDIKEMSTLTQNLLKALDYDQIAMKRYQNMAVMSNLFRNVNQLNIFPVMGGFMYPLKVKDGNMIRRKLQEKKIYIPTLWSDTFEICNEKIESKLVNDILPLPIDQRYDNEDMQYIAETVKDYIC